jgi:hypothetical protein
MRRPFDLFVIPAKAGIPLLSLPQRRQVSGIPASAGMTVTCND